MQPAEVVLIVLAAGRGQRLGGVAKALLESHGRSYLARIRASALAAGVQHGVVVVAEPHAAAVASEAHRLGLHVVDNPQPEFGMARSIECGFAWATSSLGAAALLWPCDHPLVEPATVTALIAAIADAPGVIPMVEQYGGQRGGQRGGHPALVSRSLFTAMTQCSKLAEGARSVLRAAAVRRISIRDQGCIVDVDDPAAALAVAAAGSR
jgi:molybdenum cofactor cytidylyltransferase